ncbi:MAG: trypsin-like peptidase domain-containing protein, partial [Candidatus Limnocylindrales bacterium]
MNMFADIPGTISGLAERHSPAVVRIEGGWRGASGVVVAAGQVMTNAHNVRDEEVHVTFHDGRTAKGTVVGVNPDGDLAVLTVDTAETEPIAWMEGDAVTVGTPVFALSSSGQGGRITFGFVSSVARA